MIDSDFKDITDDLKGGFKKQYRELIAKAVPPITYHQTLQKKGWAIEHPKLEAAAYCDERDTFDENVGMDVCAAKLDYKQHMKLAKRYDRAHRLLLETAHIVYGLCMKHYEKAQAIQDDMVKTYGRMPL